MVTVLHVLEALETGCARHLVDLVEHADVDHVVAAPATRVGGHTDPRSLVRLRAAASVHPVEMRRSPTNPANVAAVRTVRRLLRETGAHVVHGHSSIGGVVARLAAAGTGVPVVYTPNGLASGALAGAIERTLRPLTTAIVAVSPSEHEDVVRRRLAPPDRVVTIPNGIARSAPPRPEPSLRTLVEVPDGATLVGSIGRLVDQKAPLDLVAGWGRIGAALPAARFVLVGDGPLAAATDRLATEVGLDGRYTRLPYLPDADAHLVDLDVLTMASRFEGAPYVVLEAMRAGVPVVATRVVGSRDLLDGGAGTLVPPGRPDLLAAATLAVLAERPDPGPAQLRVTEHHDVAGSGRTHTELYDAIARAGRRWPRAEVD